eukprot:1886911-Rhodomonas_salina.1
MLTPRASEQIAEGRRNHQRARLREPIVVPSDYDTLRETGTLVAYSTEQEYAGTDRRYRATVLGGVGSAAELLANVL